MVALRKMGNMIQYHAQKSEIAKEELCKALEIDETQLCNIYCGRAILSFAQIQKLAKLFDISIQEIMAGDDMHYRHTVVHCMEEFIDDDNRETILDIIDAYIDVSNFVSI